MDSGYALQDGFLSPYRGMDYHIQEYRRRQTGVRGPKELYNYTHSSLRNCIERTFGVWKARFPILKIMRPYPLEKQAMIPIACAVLHNFIKVVSEPDPLLDEYEGDAIPVEDIDPQNVESNDADNDASANLPRTTHRRLSRARMNQFRDQMAEQMWEAFPSRRWVR